MPQTAAMTPEDCQKVKELCHLALEQAPEERSAFLAKACPNDETLRREIESMIARYTAGEGILDAPVWESLNRIPATLGRYRVLQLVGERGMGAVYEAEQDHPRRIVALKVIKPGLATPDLLYQRWGKPDKGAEWRPKLAKAQ